MNANQSGFTLGQLLNPRMPETFDKADEELRKNQAMGYKIASETIHPYGEIFVRFIRLEREQAGASTESAIGKLVREHGKDATNKILQQESVDEAWKAGKARRAYYQNIQPVPLPALPTWSDD